ncbi:MAG: hypothetical protein ACLFWL_13640 [Candidatus Brocadiia bacterium]
MRPQHADFHPGTAKMKMCGAYSVKHVSRERKRLVRVDGVWDCCLPGDLPADEPRSELQLSVSPRSGRGRGSPGRNDAAVGPNEPRVAIGKQPKEADRLAGGERGKLAASNIVRALRRHVPRIPNPGLSPTTRDRPGVRLIRPYGPLLEQQSAG